jgi:predicted nucleic acid-binding protein
MIVFGDALYFLALANPRDQHHAVATEFAKDYKGRIVTTRWILAEVCDGLSSVTNRPIATVLMEQMTRDPRFVVVTESDEYFERGLELFNERRDKEWSLTDCISFVVTADEGLTDALTADRHFGQAGFTALLVK